MKKQGVGNESGTEYSRQQGEALTALKRCLADVEFPTHKDELLAAAGDRHCFTAPNGDEWTVSEILRGLPVDEFSSAEHVSEVVSIRWEDMADLFRPGGTGPQEPWSPERPAHVRGHTTEDAMRGRRESEGSRR